jgi:hypothetical protein
MSFRATIEKIDADYFIPRPADEPDLDSFHAASRFLKDVSRSGSLLLRSSIAGYLFFRSGQILNLEFKWMTFVLIGALSAALIGVFEGVSMAYPYYSINQRLTHGSARWASIADLKARGLAHSSRKPLPFGAVRIGRLSSALSLRQYDLILSLKHLLTHTGIFGPSDSGKSATFYMNILRDFSQFGSALVMDVKGELYAHTARYYRHVYRIDLENPARSDLWNPLPRCLGNGELAHSIASILVGYEPENMKVNDSTHYWISGETALLKALCLHLPTVALNPTLPMIKEYLSLNDLKKLGEEMQNSTDLEARIEWGNFIKVDAEKTQGGVITGINNKLAPLRSPNAMRILRSATKEELTRGIREVNLEIYGRKEQQFTLCFRKRKRASIAFCWSYSSAWPLSRCRARLKRTQHRFSWLSMKPAMFHHQGCRTNSRSEDSGTRLTCLDFRTCRKSKVVFKRMAEKPFSRDEESNISSWH